MLDNDQIVVMSEMLPYMLATQKQIKFEKSTNYFLFRLD